jgi:AraC-like DNA-binding protein
LWAFSPSSWIWWFIADVELAAEGWRRYNLIHMLSEPIGRHAFRGLCDARELLVSRLDCEMTIVEAARVAKLSPYHFIRKFEALFGQTPHQLRIQARLDRAKWLLARGHHSVTEACMEVGFSSLGTFSDLFTRRMGEPPSAYRRRVRQTVSVLGFKRAGAVLPRMFELDGLPAGVGLRNFQEAFGSSCLVRSVWLENVPVPASHADRLGMAAHGGES